MLASKILWLELRLLLTSRYHLANQVWVDEATARTGFCATKEIQPLMRV